MAALRDAIFHIKSIFWKNFYNINLWNSEKYVLFQPKYKPGDIPHYDGTESDDGSSYVEGQSDEENWDEVRIFFCDRKKPLSKSL